MIERINQKMQLHLWQFRDVFDQYFIRGFDTPSNAAAAIAVTIYTYGTSDGGLFKLAGSHSTRQFTK